MQAKQTSTETAANRLREKIIADLKELHFRYGRPQREMARAAGWKNNSNVVHKLIHGVKTDMSMRQAADLELAISKIRGELAKLA